VTREQERRLTQLVTDYPRSTTASLAHLASVPLGDALLMLVALEERGIVRRVDGDRWRR